MMQKRGTGTRLDPFLHDIMHTMTISHTKGPWNSSNTSYPKKALRQYSHRYETTRNKNVHYSFVSDIEKRINNLNVYQKQTGLNYSTSML